MFLHGQYSCQNQNVRLNPFRKKSFLNPHHWSRFVWCQITQINPNPPKPNQNISHFTFSIEVRCIPGTHGTGLLWFVCISISLSILFLIFSYQFYSKMNNKKIFLQSNFFFQKYSLKMKFFLKWFSTSKRWMVLDCSRLLQLPSSPPGRVISTPPEMTVARCHHGNILDLKLGLVLDNARERVPP